MANLSRSINILFNGKETITPVVGKIAAALNVLESGIHAINEPLRQATVRMLEFEAAALATAGTVGGFALKKFSDYQFALIDLNKVLDDTEKKTLPAAEEALQSLARVYGESTVGLINNTTAFRRASFTLDESLLLLENSLKLTSAANTDMSTSTENLISILKGFNFTAEASTHIIDSINIISDKYATNAEELGIALAKLSPIAETAGLSFDELVGFVTPVIEVFRDGEESATALRRGLIKVVDDAKPVVKVLDELEIAQRDANGQLRPARDIIFDIAAAFEGASRANQLYIASEIFGNRQTARLLASLRDLNYVLEIESVSAAVTHDYTVRQVQERWDALQVRFKSARETIDQASIALGARLAPAAEAVLDSIENLFDGFRKNLSKGSFQPFFKLIEELGKDLANYIDMIGEALPDILADLDYSKFLEGFERLKFEITGVFQDLEITTPEGLKSFIQDFVDISGNFLAATAGVARGIRTIVSLAEPFIDRFKEMGTSAVFTASNVRFFLGVLDKLGVVKSTAFFNTSLILKIIDHFSDGIEEAKNKITKSTKELVDGSVKQFERLGDEIVIPLERAENSFKAITIDEEIRRINREAVLEATRIKENLFDALDLDTWIKETNASLESNENREAWEAYKRDAVGTATEVTNRLKKEGEFVKTFNDQVIGSTTQTIQDSMGKTSAFLGAFGDEQVEAFEKADAAGTRLSKTLEDSYKPIEEVEPPADEKFKAAQELLREEVRTNASVMQEQYRTLATEIESDSERITTAMQTVNDTFEASTSSLTTLYQTLATQDLDLLTRTQITAQLEAEERRQQEAFELQKELTEAQINLLNKRSQALESGEALITVSGDGLQPHLEAFMWEILSAIQIRASESYNSFLLGLS